MIIKMVTIDQMLAMGQALSAKHGLMLFHLICSKLLWVSDTVPILQRTKD